MDLTFSKMAVDTSLAQEYMTNNESLLKLYNDYSGPFKGFTSRVYDGKKFSQHVFDYIYFGSTWNEDHTKILLNMASSFKQNATLIAQLEYHFRNIPIEDTKAQLNLIIQYIRCHSESGLDSSRNSFRSNDPLLELGVMIGRLCRGGHLASISKATAPICHLLVTLLREAGAKTILVNFLSEDSSHEANIWPEIYPVKGLDSGTVAVVSDDADVDSAVDKFISVSKQAPWRLRRILVQESVYQRFKDALTWKCNLNQSGSGSKPLSSDALCSDTLTYNGKTFLIDPVEVTEEKPSAVTVEAYRTTKEMISLVQQDKPRYLSLWTNGIAEINEVTHGTKSPVVWVNNVADFRGPPQVAEAVFSYSSDASSQFLVRKCDKVARLCELAQSWLKLDLESRRDIMCGALDKNILLEPENKLYTDIRNALTVCTPKSFVDAGKDFVCIGMSEPVGIIGTRDTHILFTIDGLKSILYGNALLAFAPVRSSDQPLTAYAILEQAGVPVVYVGELAKGDFKVDDCFTSSDIRTRVIWTNSGTIFAN